MIGKAYDVVEQSKKIIGNAKNVADVGRLLAETAYWHFKTQDFDFEYPGYEDSDVGAARILGECHYLFDVLTLKVIFQSINL